MLIICMLDVIVQLVVVELVLGVLELVWWFEVCWLVCRSGRKKKTQKMSKQKQNKIKHRAIRSR